VFVRGGSEAYGHLIVDNGAVGGNRQTILPALGGGVAVPGSGGATLVTDRASAIPEYFVGHWVEVRDGATNELEGTWRIGSIGVDGKTVTLLPESTEPVTVGAGDRWQGVYRFDRYTVGGQVQVLSADPIRVVGEQVITGMVETSAVSAGRLVVKPGAVLTQHVTGSSSSPSRLVVEVEELVVESGGAIDVTGRGYGSRLTYSGAVAAGDVNGGSHLGEGGVRSAPGGSTYGSVVRPQENGGGSGQSRRGGGAVRIVAQRVQIDGVVRANGQSGDDGGAGGSVWIEAQTLAGTGSIEADGGSASSGSWGSGGGGAIALDFGAIDPEATLLDHVHAHGGTTQISGGAGSVYLLSPTANLGTLSVDNGTTVTKRTVLPPLGRGVVQDGSHDNVVLTGRDADIPAYFVGSWFEVEGPDRYVKGIWRIASVSGTTVTLEPKPGVPFTIAPGDRWRGLYRFDEVIVAPGSVLVSTDPIVQLVPPLPASYLDAGASHTAAELAALQRLGGTPDSSAVRQSDESAGGGEAFADAGSRATTSGAFEGLYGNDDAPLWDEREVMVAVGSVPGSYQITLRPGAVSDADGISRLQLTSGARYVAADWSAGGASILWAGEPGQQLHLVATDAHGRFQRSGWLELPPLPAGEGWSQLALDSGTTPLAVTGGADWLAVGDEGVTLYGTGPAPVLSVAPQSADDEVQSLTATAGQVVSATRGRIDLISRAGSSLLELGTGDSLVLDAIGTGTSGGDAGTSGSVAVLLLDHGDPVAPRMKLAEIAVADGEPVAWLPVGESTLDPLGNATLLRTADGYLHAVGHTADGTSLVHTWPSAVAGEAAMATPATTQLASPTWRAVGAWEQGMVLIEPTGVRLLEHGASGWSERSTVDLGVAVTSAAVVGTNLVVTVPGEVVVFDVSEPSLPLEVARHPGSSYTAVAPLASGDVVLWAPRMAVPPLRFDPATAQPGVGFQVVIDGLP
jgi:hypothetical protein